MGTGNGKKNAGVWRKKKEEEMVFEMSNIKCCYSVLYKTQQKLFSNVYV